MSYYNTNLSDSQWEHIEKILNDQRKRKYSLRFIINAILYITKTGVQRRMLPKDFPKWQLVYYYFNKWAADGLTEQIHDILIQEVRKSKQKEASPSLGLLDSQSVKTASVTQEKGIDGNKKVQGRKRFIVTDTLGLILAIIVCPANIAEREGAKLVFQALPKTRQNSCRPRFFRCGVYQFHTENVWLDSRNCCQSCRCWGISGTS